jgi:hypothetical protein
VSYRLSVDVIGADELARAFREAPMITERELKRSIGTTAFRVEREAKQNAPIDQGILRGSINTDGPHKRGNDVQASVGTNVSYAKAQEEGTGIYGPRRTPIRPKVGKVLAWKRDGKWHFARQVKGVKPKLYFKRARDDNRGYFTDQMRHAMNAIVSALAR